MKIEATQNVQKIGGVQKTFSTFSKFRLRSVPRAKISIRFFYIISEFCLILYEMVSDTPDLTRTKRC